MYTHINRYCPNFKIKTLVERTTCFNTIEKKIIQYLKENATTQAVRTIRVPGNLSTLLNNIIIKLEDFIDSPENISLIRDFNRMMTSVRYDEQNKTIKRVAGVAVVANLAYPHREYIARTIVDTIRATPQAVVDTIRVTPRVINTIRNATPQAVSDTIRAIPPAVIDTLRATPPIIIDIIRATPQAISEIRDMIPQEVSDTIRAIPPAVIDTIRAIPQAVIDTLRKIRTEIQNPIDDAFYEKQMNKARQLEIDMITLEQQMLEQ